VFALKLDSLLKHEGCNKTKVSMLGVDAKSTFFNKDFIHAKNECCYTNTNCPSIVDPCKPMSFMNSNGNMCNLLLFFICFLMVIP